MIKADFHEIYNTTIKKYCELKQNEFENTNPDWEFEDRIYDFRNRIFDEKYSLETWKDKNVKDYFTDLKNTFSAKRKKYLKGKDSIFFLTFMEKDWQELRNKYLEKGNEEETLKYDAVETIKHLAMYFALDKLYQEFEEKRMTILEENRKINAEKEIIEKSKSHAHETTYFVLFHYYKQVGKLEPLFEKIGIITKRDAMKNRGEKYGVGGDAFANKYYALCEAGKQNMRITKANIPHIEKVIQMLSDYPEGKKEAEIELKAALLLP